MGSWVDYALGSTNENLPSFVTMVPGTGVSGGKALWNNGFLPGKHQGVQFMVRNKEAVFFFLITLKVSQIKVVKQVLMP